MIEQEEWAKLWDIAKDLEKEIAVRKKRYYSQIKSQFPDIKYQNYGRTKVACENGWLDGEIVKVVMEYQKIIADLEKEASQCRKKNDFLLKEKQESDKRIWLDPNVGIIPEGEYPKLKECKTYPLRRSCNHGENESSKWKRCECMEYDNSKSFDDPNRWICTAPE